MKRTIATILLLVTISVTFVGCAEVNALDMVMDLKTKGFRTTSTYVTTNELELATTIVASDVKIMKGTFDVEVVEMYNLSDSDGKGLCTFIVFKTTKQAKQYARLKLSQIEYKSYTPPFIDGYPNK